MLFLSLFIILKFMNTIYNNMEKGNELEPDLDEINNYMRIHKFECKKMINDDYRTSDPSMAKYICDNFNKMELKEKSIIQSKLLSEKKINCDLLKYELKYLDLHTNINNLNESIKFIRNALNRYHMVVGGFLFEDIVWSEHDHKSYKYALDDNEYIFENSIKKIHRYDTQMIQFTLDLLNYFKRHINSDLNIICKFIKHSDEILWTIIKIETNNDTDNDNDSE